MTAFGRVDGLVINHGILSPRRVAEASPEEFRHVYDVNVFSYLAMVSPHCRIMRTRT